MSRRRKRRFCANLVYDRYYFTECDCQFLNCVFNYHGKCLKRQSEQGPKPRTFDEDCFMNSFFSKTPAELRKLFRKNVYSIDRCLLPNDNTFDEIFKPPEYINVTLLRVRDPMLVEVTFKAGKHVQRSTLFFRDLFHYELLDRNREFNAEEERLSDRVDFDSIRRTAALRNAA